MLSLHIIYGEVYLQKDFVSQYRYELNDGAMPSVDYEDSTVNHLNHATRMSTINHQNWKSMLTVEKVQENDSTTKLASWDDHFEMLKQIS